MDQLRVGAAGRRQPWALVRVTFLLRAWGSSENLDTQSIASLFSLIHASSPPPQSAASSLSPNRPPPSSTSGGIVDAPTVAAVGMERGGGEQGRNGRSPLRLSSVVFVTPSMTYFSIDSPCLAPERAVDDGDPLGDGKPCSERRAWSSFCEAVEPRRTAGVPRRRGSSGRGSGNMGLRLFSCRERRRRDCESRRVSAAAVTHFLTSMAVAAASNRGC